MLAICKIPLDEDIANDVTVKPGTKLSPEECKALALQVAFRGLGRVAPNPLVGAVLVDDQHRLLGMGAHLRCGEAHAEVNALSFIDGQDLSGATMYVTLEPCTIVGRTPACAPRLVQEGIGHVVVGSLDVHPDVNGRGLQELRDAGIDVTHDTAWQDACNDLAEIFLFNCTHRRPLVAAKVASGVDGNMAQQGDRREWITGPRARQYGHFLRCYYDAILVGVNTVLADDPLLDARDALTPRRDPLPVIVDPQARLNGVKVKLFCQRDEPLIWIVDKEKAPAAQKHAPAHVKVLGASMADGQIDPSQIVQLLHGEKITSILLEGGPTTIGRFASAGLVDKMHVFQSAAATCGPNVLNWSGAAPSPARLTFERPVLTQLGEDWMIEMRTKRGNS